MSAAAGTAARRITRDAVRAEARRLRTEEGLTFRQIGDRLGVSETTAWQCAGDLKCAVRRCKCGAEFSTDSHAPRKTCQGCREDAAERERQREAKRRALVCDECGDTLLVPAAFCGFCDPDFDTAAALAALDNEERPAVTGRSTTHREETP